MKCKNAAETSLTSLKNNCQSLHRLATTNDLWGSVFVARCPNCMSESSRYIEEEDAKTKGVAEVFE